MSTAATSAHSYPIPRLITPERPPAGLTITIDVASEATSERLLRLVELLAELVDAGEGALRVDARARTLLASARLPRPASPTRAPASLRPVLLRRNPDTLVLDVAGRDARQGLRRLGLTRIEFDLLLFLAEHPRQVFTRRQLLARVWGHEHSVTRTVDVHVRRLRAKVGDDVPLVTTVHGVGYRLADEAVVFVDRGH